MNILLLLIFLPIFIGILFYIIKTNQAWMIISTQSSLFLIGVYCFFVVRTNGPISMVVGKWPKGKGVSLYLDQLSAVMLLLTTFFFILFFLHEYHQFTLDPLFVFLLFTLEGLLCAVFITHDLFNFFVLMEVSTILVTILIIYKKYRTSYYDGLIYLLTNIVGMSFFLLGVGYIYRMYGVFDMDLLKTAINTTPISSSILLPYILILTGISFKIGVMPVFTWLPRAHGSQSAPSVVSAILSGIYINIGFIFFIKFQSIFENIFYTRTLFLCIGLMTAFLGGLLALIQDDIKKLLGYSTVSQIGFILTGINLNGSSSFYGSIYHILSHSIFKVLLFLIAGIIIHQFNTRKISEIQGVFQKNPLVGLCTIAGILGITGAPFFNGSIGKYLISKGSNSFSFELILYALNFITILYLAKFSTILFGKGRRTSVQFPQAVVISILSIFCLLGGLYAPLFMRLLFNYPLQINSISYLIKSFLYIISVVGGFYLYKYKIQHASLLKILREIDLPFNFIVGMIFVLFMIITVFSYFSSALIAI